MWMAIISFLGGPVIKGLIEAYQAKLKAGNVDSKISADLGANEIAAQASETNAILQYRVAEIGHWYEPDKLMGYFVALYFVQAPGVGQGARTGDHRSTRRICLRYLEPRGVVLFRKARI
jgi:hypothetical protein